MFWRAYVDLSMSTLELSRSYPNRLELSRSYPNRSLATYRSWRGKEGNANRYRASDAGEGGWEASDGGALELYATSDPDGEPEAQPCARLVPQWNSMLLFRVEPGKSFHAVQEVYGEKPRLTISGWSRGVRFGICEEISRGFEFCETEVGANWLSATCSDANCGRAVSSTQRVPFRFALDRRETVLETLETVTRDIWTSFQERNVTKSLGYRLVPRARPRATAAPAADGLDLKFPFIFERLVETVSGFWTIESVLERHGPRESA